MTRPDIEAIRERATSATDGPWQECGHDRGGCKCRQVWSVPVDAPIAYMLKAEDEDWTGGEGVTEPAAKWNAAFVANARTDIPALLDYIAELERDKALIPISDIRFVLKVLGKVRNFGFMAPRGATIEANVKRAFDMLNKYSTVAQGNSAPTSSESLAVNPETAE